MNFIFFKLKIIGNNWSIGFLDTNDNLTIIKNREELINYFNRHKDNIFIGMNNFKGENKIIASIIKNGNLDGNINDKDLDTYLPRTLDLSQGIVRNNLVDMDKSILSMWEDEQTPTPNFSSSKLEDMDKEVISKLQIMKKIYGIEERRTFINWKIKLIEEFKLDKSAYRASFGTLMLQILGLNPAEKDAKGKDFTIDQNLEELLREENSEFLDEVLSKVKKYYDSTSDKGKIKIGDCEISLNDQGILGSIPQDYYDYSGDNVYLYIDFNSFGPNILINNNWLDGNAKNPEKLSQIKDRRIKLKAQKKTEQLFYKYILNSSLDYLRGVYTKDNKNVGISLAVTGILTVLLLYERIKKYDTYLIECNTDGLIVKCPKENVEFVKEEVRKIEEKLKLSCDVDVVKRIIHFDTKNYIMEFDNGTIKHLGVFGTFQEGELNGADCEAINIALREYYFNNIPVSVTLRKLRESNNLKAFQIINKSRANGKTKYTLEDGNYQEVTSNSNRLYAVKDFNNHSKFYTMAKKGFEVYKTKRGRSVKEGYYFFEEANTTLPDINNIDLNYYIDECYKVILSHPKNNTSIILGKDAKSAFIDLDGTLISDMSTEDGKNIFGLAAINYVDPANLEYTHTIFSKFLLYFLGRCKKEKGYGTIDNFARYLKEVKFIDDSLTIDDYKIIIANYLRLEEEHAMYLSKYPKAGELLAFLKDKGYDVYLYSNWFRDVQMAKLNAHNLTDCFDGIYTIDNSYAKSSVKGWEAILADTSTKKSADNIMIGNGSSDMVPKKIEMPSIVVNHTNRDLPATVLKNGIIIPNFAEIIDDRYFEEELQKVKKLKFGK